MSLFNTNSNNNTYWKPESKCYCITGITVGIQDSDIKGQGNVKEPDLQTKFKKSKVVTDLIHDFNMKYIKGTRSQT
ncbi:hypothetical protein GLOIN_2v1775890 [Rhizophagus irregularis DAOM 181602=DAOM 197198]|nr:hypothetical protein GLOIN_2v1775890 [Rhizophagus irregularis DAOM 181602=DAOM 197198]